MPRLFLIRHAEPAAGWGGAHADPGLTERGRAQAQAAAQSLAEYGPLDVLTSPMARCRETAAPFAALRGAEALIEPRVSEVVAPAGVTDRPAWLRNNFPWDEGLARRHWSDVDAELQTWRDAAVRAVSAIARDTAVFSHFIAINAIVSAALGSDNTIVFRPGHASITELELSPSGLRVVMLGAEMQSADVR
ncbi:MAG: histidine phosphatase family protein [Alphaproteobacteria bacterium]|nr:MAG: histidine phosphatase family protein [Alphaproteobacteria bacterium]